MDELLSLEKHIGLFAQKADEILEVNNELKEHIFRLEQENQALRNKIHEIDLQLSKPSKEEDLFGNTSLTLEDKEVVKNKISELISKLDYHLRS
jgi:hypothetical protein